METSMLMLKERYTIAQPEDLTIIREQVSSERPIVLLNLLSRVIHPLVNLVIAPFALVTIGETSVLTGFTSGNRTPVRMRIRAVRDEDPRFEIQNLDAWRSPFRDGAPATLYMLKN